MHEDIKGFLVIFTGVTAALIAVSFALPYLTSKASGAAQKVAS